MTELPPLTYNIDQAVERIGPLVTADYLRKHLDEFPHCRAGKGTGRAGRIAFTEAHLAEIVTMLEKRPARTPAPDLDDWGVIPRGRRRSVGGNLPRPDVTRRRH